MKPIKISASQLRGLITEAIQTREPGQPEPYQVEEGFEDHFEKERSRIGSEWIDQRSHVNRDDALHAAKRYLMALEGVDEHTNMKEEFEDFCSELASLLGRDFQ